MQVANTPAVITCTDVMAEEHPELVVAYMGAMIKVGRWANDHKRAAAVILNRQTFYLDAEDTYEGIKHVDMVPSLSAQNLQCIDIGSITGAIGGYAEAWPARRFVLRGDFLYVKVKPGDEEAAVTDWRLAADYYFFRNAGLGVQYKFNRYSYDRGILVSELGGEVTFQGLQVYLSFLF